MILPRNVPSVCLDPVLLFIKALEFIGPDQKSPKKLKLCSVGDLGCLSRIWIFPSHIPDLDFSIRDSGSGLLN